MSADNTHRPDTTNSTISYILQAVGLLVPLTWLVALIMDYSSRGTYRGTWLESHYTFRIRTFWLGTFGTLITLGLHIGHWVMLAIAVHNGERAEALAEHLGGAVILWALSGAVWLWMLFRVIRGLIRHTDARAMYA